VKYGSARKCRRKFCHKFLRNTVPSTRGIHELIKKIRSTGSLLDKKPARECYVLTEERLVEIGTRSEHTPQESLRYLVQKTSISKLLAAIATKLLKCRPYKATVVHALQTHVPVNRTEG
jgi:hypothetical protein